MARSKLLIRSIALVAATGMALSACGGDGGTGDDGQPPAGGDGISEDQKLGEVLQGDGEFVVGTLLPDTGSLAVLGPPMLAGVTLAVEDINKAGGVLGKDIRWEHADSGDTESNIAGQGTDQLLAAGSDVIIGAASSSVSLSVLDKIINKNALMLSPANTSAAFDPYKDKGLYYRTAPSDNLQGRVLGDWILEDGAESVCILALQDAYGTGYAASTERTIEAGGGTVAKKIIYDPKAAEYSAEVSQVKAAGCDAIVIIGFAESTKIFAELVKQGMPTSKYKWYLSDGNADHEEGALPKDMLDGAKLVLAGGEVQPDFGKRLRSARKGVKINLYGPESYDSVVVTALAAMAANNDSGTGVASKLADVSGGGEKCTSFEQCKTLLDEGKDIDYDGISGPIDFDEIGNPSIAWDSKNVFEGNTYKPIEYLQGKTVE